MWRNDYSWKVEYFCYFMDFLSNMGLHDLKLYTYKLNNSCLIYIHILSVRMDFSKHNQGTTSVKVHHAPGGRSNFSLAWDEGPTKPTKTAPRSNNPVVPLKETNQPTDAKTSVKVHNPPGGRSNILFGWIDILIPDIFHPFFPHKIGKLHAYQK